MISDKRKQRIKQKARDAANKGAAPAAAEIADAKADLKKDYGNQVGASKAAQQQVLALLASAAAGAKSSGLKGRYLKSTLAELEGQQGDAAKMVKFTRSQLRPEFIDNLQSLNKESKALERSTAQSAREALQSRLAEIRETKAAEAAEARENRRGRVVDNKNATIVMHNLLDGSRDLAQTEIEPPPDDASDSDVEAYEEAKAEVEAEQQFLDDLYSGNRQAVRHFAAALASRAEGLDQQEAMAFVKRMIERRRAQEIVSGDWGL